MARDGRGLMLGNGRPGDQETVARSNAGLENDGEGRSRLDARIMSVLGLGEWAF